MKKNLVRAGVAAGVWALPLLALAGLNLGLDNVGKNLDLGTRDIRETVGQLINVFMGILGTIAIIIVLIGGFTWMTAAGNPKKIDEAKAMLKGGVIGLIIVLVAYSITKFVLTALTTATQ